MKIYNWEEAIVKLKENNKLVFEDVNSRLVLKYENGCVKFFDVNDENICLHALVLDRQFKLKEEPVTFMEAVNSGRRIKPDSLKDEKNYHPYTYWLGYMVSSIAHEGSPADLINGKWYIEL